MLRELNTIANDLLGLHGYPMRPVAWGAIFGKRANAEAAKICAKPSTDLPAAPAKTARPAARGRIHARSHA